MYSGDKSKIWMITKRHKIQISTDRQIQTAVKMRVGTIWALERKKGRDGRLKKKNRC